MKPAASPRHPWKALAAVIATFAFVHAAGARVFPHGHDVRHITVSHLSHADEDSDDCPDADVHFGPNFPFDDDGPGDHPAVDAFDHDFD